MRQHATSTARRRRSVYSAGVLVFAFINSVLHVLLGADRDRLWSDFGGRCEPCDDGDPASTAMRELDEETLCVVHPEGLLVHEDPVIARTLRGNLYFMYVALLRDELVVPSAIGEHYAARMRARSRPVEKTELGWFEWARLTDGLALRDVFLRSIETRRADIAARVDRLATRADRTPPTPRADEAPDRSP
jgi:hypothetical protein